MCSGSEVKTTQIYFPCFPHTGGKFALILGAVNYAFLEYNLCLFGSEIIVSFTLLVTIRKGVERLSEVDSPFLRNI